MRLRDEITRGHGSVDDVQMSLFNAVYTPKGQQAPDYAKAAYYGEITFPSKSLVGLMGQIGVRLGSTRYASAKAVWRLDQGMGGGKSHGLIGLWHLAAHTSELLATDLGKQVFSEAERIAGTGQVAADLGKPVCVVLSCDNMTPGRSDGKDVDGPAETLGEKFLWRLFDGATKRWSEYREHSGNKAKLAEAIEAVGRPVLILVDEVMDYIRTATESNDATKVAGDMAFLRALLDVVNDVPNVAMVMVMIASDKDSLVLTSLGERCRDELVDLLTRNAWTESVTNAADFSAIIRRRLFENPPPAEVVKATVDAYLSGMAGHWGKEVFGERALQQWATPSTFREMVERTYPFHPALMDLMEREWSLNAGFQRVRSTIQIFAATAWSQVQRAKTGWVPLLIGPGDLPLSNPDVRGAILNSGVVADQRTASSFREIALAEVVGENDDAGTARLLDVNRRADCGYLAVNPRAAERAATALFVYSVGPRAQGRQGATEAELKAATFVPSNAYGTGDADIVLAELRDADSGLAALEELTGKGGQPNRLLLSTRQTLNMLYRARRATVTDAERDEAVAATAKDLAKTGPFKDLILVRVTRDNESLSPLEMLRSASIDDARKTRLVVLDHRRFSFGNGAEPETRAAIRAAMGLGNDKLPVAWASSAVYVVANTRLRGTARGFATEFIARQQVTEIDSVKADAALAAEAAHELDNARDRLRKAVRDAYQHIVYLKETTDDGKSEMVVTLDPTKNEGTGLDGTVVWSALGKAEKVFGRGEFDAKALLHNLRDSDYNMPLSEVRDAFWNTPRLPLLFNGEDDLRNALFAAITSGNIRLLDKDNQERAVTTAQDVNLASTGLRIARPAAADDHENDDNEDHDHHRGDGEDQDDRNDRDDTSGEVKEWTVGVSLTKTLDGASVRNAVRVLLNALGNAVDSDASHVQLTVKVTAPAGTKDAIEAKAKAAGAHVNATEL